MISALFQGKCYPKARRIFSKHLSQIDADLDSLVNATMAIAMHAFEDLDCEDVWQKINRVTRKISERVSVSESRGNVRDILIHLNQVFFIEEGYVAKPDGARVTPD